MVTKEEVLMILPWIEAQVLEWEKRAGLDHLAAFSTEYGKASTLEQVAEHAGRARAPRQFLGALTRAAAKLE